MVYAGSPPFEPPLRRLCRWNLFPSFFLPLHPLFEFFCFDSCQLTAYGLLIGKEALVDTHEILYNQTWSHIHGWFHRREEIDVPCTTARKIYVNGQSRMQACWRRTGRTLSWYHCGSPKCKRAKTGTKRYSPNLNTSRFGPPMVLVSEL